ncbi:MAG TPA: ABC transporter permease, partial [Chitinophagaceae bacterium]|nr:ABC transporter permease [Chitinophagaceae bacterium]
MIKNYIKIAWRNMLRNKVNSLINISGLAIGIASVMLILFYVHDEMSYDKFLKNSDHIFQVNLTANLEGNQGSTTAAGPNSQVNAPNANEFTTGNTPPPVGNALVTEFPEVEAAVRIYRPGEILVRNENGSQIGNFFTEKNLIAVDSNFLQVFSYGVKEGNPVTCLQELNSLAITERAAKKYFGDQNPIGKILLLGDSGTAFTVTAILNNLPVQSSIQFEMLAPISSYPMVKRFSWSWVWLQVNTYVKLKDNVAVDQTAIQKMEAKFPAMVKKYGAAGFRRIGKPIDSLLAKGGKWDLHLQPITTVHLHAMAMGTDARQTNLGNIRDIYIFSIVALFIIILACVNFINLSTARAGIRAREVGIRKVLGSVKAQLIKQFLAEAMLYSIISTLFAFLLVFLLIDPFNAVAGKSLALDMVFKDNIWIYITGLTLLTGLLSGSYPAFYLTSFKPILVLKGLKFFKSGIGNLFVRNGLVVFQFAISTALIVCTIVVYRQLKFAQQKDLGFNKNNVLVISSSTRLGSQQNAFREEILRIPGVSNASYSTAIPTIDNFSDGYVPEPGPGDQNIDPEIGLSSYMVDESFIPVLHMQVTKGRNFSKEFNDSASVILNETAAREIGWKDPVGMYLQYPGNSQRFRVIGVIKDFNVESVRNMVAPFALFHLTSKTYGSDYPYTSVSIQSGNLKGIISKIEDKWKSFAAATPFDYSFLDEKVGAMYRAERRMGSVFLIFTFLSIFIACLGLFGLATYTAERRTKEVSVRKVLGASAQGLALLLSKDFLKLTFIAAFIAFPV